MISIIEPLYKSKDTIKFGWDRESGADSYKIYVGNVPGTGSMTAVVENIPDIPTKNPIGLNKIVQDVGIGLVRTALSLSATEDFSTNLLYFTITYVSGGVESDIADSTVVTVPPVGITPRYMKDDPSVRRHGFVFSDENFKWGKMAGSSKGAVIVDISDYYKTNIITDFTYDGTNISTIKSYLSDSTTGSPAKLTTYTYNGSLISKIAITDSTV